MSLMQAFKDELLREAQRTRTLLERVPMNKADWKPHAKSMALGQLAGHVAEIPGWAKMVLAQDELRFNPGEYKPRIPVDTQQLLAMHDEAVVESSRLFDELGDEVLDGNWKMFLGEQLIIDEKKLNVLRDWSMNHVVHHRAQLTVYLRLLDIPLPGMYGPSADTQ